MVCAAFAAHSCSLLTQLCYRRNCADIHIFPLLMWKQRHAALKFVLVWNTGPIEAGLSTGLFSRSNVTWTNAVFVPWCNHCSACLNAENWNLEKKTFLTWNWVEHLKTPFLLFVVFTTMFYKIVLIITWLKRLIWTFRTFFGGSVIRGLVFCFLNFILCHLLLKTKKLLSKWNHHRWSASAGW